jgi:hypothetical protein
MTGSDPSLHSAAGRGQTPFARPVKQRTTRRALLAAGAGAVLARPAVAVAQQSHAERTAQALEPLIRREQAAAFAYGLAGLPVLARHEAEHAAALRPHLQSVGHLPPPPVRVTQDLDPAARRLADAGPTGDRDAAAIALERELLAAYAGVLDSLYDPATRRTAATIMASHGQHLVTLDPGALL